MANRLKMAKAQAILALREQGWKRKRIGREKAQEAQKRSGSLVLLVGLGRCMPLRCGFDWDVNFGAPKFQIKKFVLSVDSQSAREYAC